MREDLFHQRNILPVVTAFKANPGDVMIDLLPCLGEAFARGDLSESEAAKILREQFGLK